LRKINICLVLEQVLIQSNYSEAIKELAVFRLNLMLKAKITFYCYFLP